MAFQTLAVVEQPFQSYTQITDEFVAATSTDLQFRNDGYTLLYFVATGTPTITVTSIPDNAGRIEDINFTAAANKVYAFGPLRPIWWNYGGVVQISLDATGGASFLPVRYQF